VKLLIPAGFMPSSIRDGWPIRLCDAGLRLAHHTHGGHGDGGGGDGGHGDGGRELQWKHCPLGALAAAGAIAVEHLLPLRAVEPDRVDARIVGHFVVAPVPAFRSRAPPLERNVV